MSSAVKFRLQHGWSLFTICAAAITIASIGLVIGYGEPEGVRLVIRTTARTSLLLFALAFTASAMLTLFPSAFTRWQARNRRFLGLGFAFSHLVHLAAIIVLAANNPALFMSLTNPVTIGTGALAYVFIALMAATSFAVPRRRIGERAWSWLHWSGGWYIWLSFLVATGKRVPIDLFYLPFAIFVVLILVLKIVAGYTTRRDRNFRAEPAGTLAATD